MNLLGSIASITQELAVSVALVKWKFRKPQESSRWRLPKERCQDNVRAPTQPPNLYELGFEHGLQEFAGSITQASFDRIEPVVEKAASQFRFPTAAGQVSCYDLSWRNLRRLAPESLVASSWRLRRLQFPTTPATAPRAGWWRSEPAIAGHVLSSRSHVPRRSFGNISVGWINKRGSEPAGF